MVALHRAVALLALVMMPLAIAGPIRQASSAKLPADWKQATDPKTGRHYYWHTKTRQTTWIRPVEMDAAPASSPAPQTAAVAESSASSATSVIAAGSAMADQEAEDAAPEEKQQLPPSLPIRTRAANLAGGMRSRLASAASFGHDDEASEEGGPAKSLLKGIYLSGIFVAAAAVL